MAKPRPNKRRGAAPKLLDDLDEARRERLTALGWRRTPAGDWRRPDGATVIEAEAFRELERNESEKGTTP